MQRVARVCQPQLSYLLSARHYACSVYAVALRPSVCLSITNERFIKTVSTSSRKQRRSIALFLMQKNFFGNSSGISPTRASNADEVCKIAFFDRSRLHQTQTPYGRTAKICDHPAASSIVVSIVVHWFNNAPSSKCCL